MHLRLQAPRGQARQRGATDRAAGGRRWSGSAGASSGSGTAPEREQLGEVRDGLCWFHTANHAELHLQQRLCVGQGHGQAGIC